MQAVPWYREDSKRGAGNQDGLYVSCVGCSRLPFSDVILKFREKIETLEKDVYAVLCLEREEREMQQSEAQVSVFSRIFFLP